MRRITFYISIIFLSICAVAQVPKPADPQEGPIAIMNATVHTGNGQVIENAIITFSDGKIEAVVDATNSRLDLTGYDQIDASGKHVYPGFILPSTNLGLEEVSAVRATLDYDEVGMITPNVRSQIAYNTDSEIIATFRFNGILTAQIAPQGGLVTGMSSVMMMDGWNWEDATLKEDDAMHINWPSKSYGPRWWRGETERRPNKNYDSQVASIKELFNDASSYLAGNRKEVNLKLEAMEEVLNGNRNVFVYADRAPEIVASITELKKMKVSNIVLVGGRDAYYVRDLLLEHDIPVILDNVHRMPSRPEEAIDFPFRLPGMLHKAGITVALRHQGMLSRGRNLPFYAGTTAAYGLDKEEALSLITSHPAKILGIEDQTGTIEEGKDATFFISEGDVLDMKSSIITKAFIQGKSLNLEGKQQRLYKRFKEKYSE